MAGLLQQSGAQPQKQPKWVPLFIDRAFTGIYTNRSVLHDPSDVPTTRFYGGRPDALWQGSNIELSNKLSLQRRPGLSAFSTATYPTPPNRAFSFELLDGTIRVIIDTGSTGNLTVTSVATSIGSSAVYTGTFPAAGSNHYVGLKFTITGFTATLANNGTFTCTASTTTTLTLSNSVAVSETHAAVAASTGAVYYDTQSGGVKTLLFAKSEGAGQTYFVAVAGTLYMGDGVDVQKYTPVNSNGTIWNYGIDAPTAAPTTTITESGSAATQWAASTWFSTMGLLIDSTGNVEQLLNITNGSQFGTSSNGQPTWNQTTTGTTVDNTAVWTNLGPVTPWAANTAYANQSAPTAGMSCCIYDVVTGCIFTMIRPGNANGTSGTSRPNFPNSVGSILRNDGGCDWYCRGNVNFNGGIGGWLPGLPVSGGSFILEPIGPPSGPGQPLSTQSVYIQHCTTAGTTSTSNAHPAWNTSLGTSGIVTTDNELNWISLGSPVWSAGATYFAWSGQSSTFSVVKDSNNSLWVCVVGGTSGGSTPFVAPILWQAGHSYVLGNTVIDSNSNTQQVTTAGTSGGSAPSWATNQGGTTADNTVTWTNIGSAYGTIVKESTGVQWSNVGQTSSWVANKSYNRPTAGWNPPGPNDPFGSADVNDGTNIEFVVQTGFTGSGTPSWNATTGGETIDSGAVWHNNGPFLQNSFSWSTGFQYAYSFSSRLSTDSYNIAPGPPEANLPNGLGTPTGALTGGISTASPLATISGGNVGAVITLTGAGSIDPQVDTVIIWRTADGGSTLFFLTEIPNPTPINGTPGTWTLDDYMPDLATSTLPGLNVLVKAPIDHENDPPPSSFLPMVYNFQRIWGADEDQVLFSGGPDILTGNPNESYNPADQFPFLSRVIRLVKTSQGLIVLLPNSIELIGGGPVTSTFYSVTLSPGVGLLNYNALDVYAGEIYLFTSDSQFMMMTPSLNLVTAGFPLGDQFSSWNPATARVAVQQSGTDNGIYISDGSTGWYRVNPRQVPVQEPVWSPFAAITNGCKMVQSVEVSPGIKKLLVGATSANQQILERDLTVYTDNGTPYPSSFVMGALTLAHPGQLALLKFIEADFSGVSRQPTVSYLLNEISGSFTAFSAAPQFDPPGIYGTTVTPTSYSPNRYYFGGNPSLARCRHLQIKVDFGTVNPLAAGGVVEEMFSLTVFGRLMVEL
jgi:hypothetical protein